MRWRLIGILIFLGTLLRCSSDSGSNPYETPSTFFGTMTQLTVEVAYEPGAEPYDTGPLGGHNLWTFTKNNIAALFDGRAIEPTITVPQQLSEMKALAAQNKSTWTTDAILALANANRQGVSTATSGYFYVVFLNGYLDDNGSANTGVLGVSLGGTTVIAIFKEVISGSGASDFVKKYVEQSTVTHELGHALGLVNNGIPMIAAHQDTAHGAHCTTTTCGMYWENEGKSAAVQFVQTYIATGNEVIFDTACLNDARGYIP